MKLQLLTIAFFIVGIQSSTAASLLRDEIRSTYDYTLDKIDELNATLSVKIENALKDLENDSDNAVLLMTITINNGEKNIEEVYDGLLEQLDGIKASAEEQGIVTQCLDENEDQLKDLPSKLSGDISVCATTRANQALGEIYTIINDMDSIPDTLNNLRTEVENCGPDDTCVVPILQDVLKDATILPQKVDNGTQTAYKVVSSLVETLWNCIDKRVTQMSTNGEAVIQNIVDCING